MSDTLLFLNASTWLPASRATTHRSPAVLFEFTRTASGDEMPERPNPRAQRIAASAAAAARARPTTTSRGGLTRRTIAADGSAWPRATR